MINTNSVKHPFRFVVKLLVRCYQKIVPHSLRMRINPLRNKSTIIKKALNHSYSQSETLFRTMSPVNFRSALYGINLLDEVIKYENNAHTEKHKVCVLGHYINSNIGGQLTVLATYKAIESLGYTVNIMRFSDHFTTSIKRQILWESLCKFSDSTDDNLQEVNNAFDSFVTTPDWTFHKAFSKGWDIFMQPFTSDDKKRISFAASFGDGGGKAYKPKEHPELRRRLSRFHALSIREPKSVEFCKSIGIENAIFMHDAVFSLSRSFYTKLSDLDQVERPPLSEIVSGKYSVIYLRDYTKQKVQWIIDISQQLNLSPLLLIGSKSEEVNIKKHKLCEKGIKYLTDVTMCEWLYFINHSDFVISDSFHATCFSLILNKPFALFKRTNAGLLSKLATLTTNIELSDRMFDENLEKQEVFKMLEKSINWKVVNEKLDAWRTEAITFIDKSLR